MVRRIAICVFILMIVPLATYAGVAELPAKPSHYVADYADMINTGDERALNGYLQELEQKTGTQFIVATVKSLEGESKEGFAFKLAEKWKLGRKGKDDGLLFLIAAKERKYRFEVGYGLEGILPDSFVGSVGRDVLVPYMKKNRYSEGIKAAAMVTIQEIANKKNVALSGMPKVTYNRRSGGGVGSLIFPMLFFFLFIFPMIGGAIRRSRYGASRWRGSHVPWWLFLLGGSMGGSRHHRSSGFGGFGGGGGFGGFGGGGGGGFGGGGAGGGW